MRGDNRFSEYNEPEAMRQYALSWGVAAEAVRLDFARRRRQPRLNLSLVSLFPCLRIDQNGPLTLKPYTTFGGFSRFHGTVQTFFLWISCCYLWISGSACGEVGYEPKSIP